MTETGKAMAALTDEISQEFLERSETVRAMTVAMLAGQHPFLLGPPGAAKSELARALTARITGGTYWEILLGAYTDPKQIFGPVDVGALMKGEYTQVFDGRATTADIAFVDEVFKCGDGALNSMLAFLNERVYHPENGGPPIACPLLSAVTASNELPAGGQGTEAIYDRLMVRLEVQYLADPSNFAALLRSGAARGIPAKAPTVVTLDTLRQAIQGEVPGVAVPDGVIDAVSRLRTALRHREITCSDRRWKQSVRLLQASAYLAGRPVVSDADLDILRHVLWSSTADIRPVAEEVLTLVNPDAKAALDLLEAVAGIEQKLDSMAGHSREALSTWAIKEANGKLSRAGKDLETMRSQAASGGRSTATIDEAIARHKAVYARVMTEALGVAATMVAAGAA